MAKTNDTTKGAQAGMAAASGSAADKVEQNVVAFAEQLGRIVGTVQAKAEGWLDREALNEQITQVRDSATHLLELLGGEMKHEQSSGGSRQGRQGRQGSSAGPRQDKGSNAGPVRGRSGGVVDAPGKKHRKPTPNTPVKANAVDAGRVAKMKFADASRRRGRRGG